MALSVKGKERVIEALEGLPPEKLETVLDFIDYLKMKGRGSGIDIASLVRQQQSLAKIWEGAEEDLYEL